MKFRAIFVTLLLCLVSAISVRAEAMLQLFNLTWNQISTKMPELAEAGYTALWLPPPAKANSQFSAGYDCFDPFDLGDKDQKGTIPTLYGTKDQLLSMVRIAHRFGIRVYFDNIMNHRSYDTPGYDANTPITTYPGFLPEDFHLQTTADGFYRKWPNSCFCSIPSTEFQNFSDLIDLSQESPNANFGPVLFDTNPKLVFVRQPNNPDYYPNPNLPLIAGPWYPFDGTNGVPVAEDTASFIIRAATWFVDQTKCDGFRFDAVKHVPSYFFGAYLPDPNDSASLAAGYTGAIQTMYQYVHGYTLANGYDGRAATGDTSWNNRTACFDAEAIRNDALLFGEHLGESGAEPFSAYTSRGMRLVDAPLIGALNGIIGNPSAGLQGLDQVDYDGGSYLNHFNRVMYVQSQDNDFFANLSQRPLYLSYMFMREGIANIYSDGYFQSAFCQQCGGEAFPRIAHASYLGEYGDNTMPELMNLHEQIARGGTRPRWSDNDVVAFERYDYREVTSDPFNNPDATTVLFAMNDDFACGGNPCSSGDISFDDASLQNDSGMPSTCYPVQNSRGVGLAVSFRPGSVLSQLAASGPNASDACPKILVRLATNSKAAADASANDPNPVNRMVYVGTSTAIPSGGGGIEFKIPGGGYVMYGYQGPEASWAGLKDAITVRQNGQDVPRMIVQRSTGRDGDQSYNPIFPFKMRGSINQLGNLIGSSNVGPLTYNIDIPVITNPGPIDIVVRSDASTANTLVKLDGGVDINSQMHLGPIWTNATTGAIDARDNRPGYTYDMFVGYEQPTNTFRYGPEKFAATNITRNTVISLGAETYSYVVGGTGTVAFGGGPNVNTSTAVWVYHNPLDTTDQGLAMRSSVAAGQVVTNWVKVGYQFAITTGNLYYTIDGSAPEGSFGVAKPGTTTHVVPLNFSHTSSGGDGTYDWWFGLIPAQSSGTVIYKIALYNGNVGTPISDADSSKLYGLTQFAITNFNPSTAKVWVHDDLNTNSTITGLEAGFHIIRARAFLPRSGKSSVFNTFAQTFYYDPAPPTGIVAFPPNDGFSLGSQEYGFVVRADANTTEVDYNIQDNSSANDDTITGQPNGNGNSNGIPIFVAASQVSPLPALSQQYPALPNEFRFNYVGIPSNGTATITMRLKEVTTSAFTNRYTTITRTVNCSAPPQSLQISFPTHNGDTVALDQSSFYEIVSCFTASLGTTLTNFTILIDGSVQPHNKPDGTPLYFINDAFCGNGFQDLRYDWSGMSAGQHLIQVLYNGQGLALQASRIVNVNLTGISVNIANPPAADSEGRSPFTIVLPQNCNLTPTNSSTITVSTSPTVTNVVISFVPPTNVFLGGSAVLDSTTTNASIKQWNFVWTNLAAGTFIIRADGFGGGSNTAFRTVNVVSRQFVPTNPNSDDSDNDGLSDLIESQLQTNQLNKASDNWTSDDVHLMFISGKTDPNNPDSDNDGLPDGLELGIGAVPAATNTDVNADSNCDGIKNFIPDLDPPLYNTLDNQTAPPGYEGYVPWPFNRNGSRTDQIAGTVTDPNNPDTDGDGLMDGIEDMNKNGRVDITLTNANGTMIISTNGIPGTVLLSGIITNPDNSVTTTSIVVIAHPPTIYNTSIIDRAKVLRVWPNALWLETDPNNPDSDGDGLADGTENISHTGFMAIGLLNRNIGYGSGSATVTGTLTTPYPSSILYFPNTSRVNRKALIQKYPNAVLLETDPMDAHTDGDTGGLPDGWKVRFGLNPWDDGVIGHTNWHTGALITTNLNGQTGNPSGDGIPNITKFLSGLDPNVFYSNGVPASVKSITIGAGTNIGTTAGVSWNQEFQGWLVNDLRVVRPYDGIGPNSQGHTIYPCPNGCDGFDWSRDIVAFYSRDGGPTPNGDGNYYFRVDMHDLTFGADQGKVSAYVAINVGTPGTGETAFPENLNTTTDMGWNVLVGIYGIYGGNCYVKLPSTPAGVYDTRGQGAPNGLLSQYWRADLDSIEFAISRQALLDAGWSGFTPLNFQVFTTAGGFRFGWRSAVVGTIYDNGITESMNTGYGNALHYWFTSINQNAVNLQSYCTNGVCATNRPNVAKLAILLHANQPILPASTIQGFIHNTNQLTSAGSDPTFDPGLQPTGYYRALESAQVFGVPLNLHLSGSLISALQWAQSTPGNDPSRIQDGPTFNQRIASLVATGQVSLLSGMFADHIAQYFTGAVNRTGIQLQDDIIRNVYGNNAVTPDSPVYLAERVVNGPTLSDLAANSGHNFIILDQMVHLWWWGEQLYGFGNGRQAALGDDGYRINKFNGMRAFLISGASDQMYQNTDLGTPITMRELLIRKALDTGYDQVVILGDNWETAGGIGGGNVNPDAFNLNIRWIANHQWIKVVTLDKFGTGQADINNDGTVNGPGGDFPTVVDRGTSNFSTQAKDFIRHACETNYDNWFYGSSQEQSFYNQQPIRSDGQPSVKLLGHVLTNGTILADTWSDVQGATGSLSNLAKLVYLNGIFETAFHNEDNTDYDRFSTGDYKSPDTTFDTLATFAQNPNARATRQASIVAHAAQWAMSAPSATATNYAQDVDQDGENEYILANNRVYAVFERRGGRMIAAFARDPLTGNAYQMVGNLVSTPDFADEREGDLNFSGTPPAPFAYRASGFKDWYAGTNQYVNDLYTVTNAPSGTGWQLTSSDGKISKVIRLASGDTKLDASYTLNGPGTLYVRHGLSPNLLSLLYQGQGNLQGPTDAGGKVTVINSNAATVATVSANYADSGHSNTTYNAAATDAGTLTLPMRNLAQTQQIELQGTGPAFSFALNLVAADANDNLDSVGDGIPDWWRSQYFGGSGTNTNSVSCATCDPDGDGMNNLAEFIAGTSPTDSTSLLRIISITRQPNGDNVIVWASAVSKNYQVYATTNLSVTYAPVGGTVPSAGATTSYTDAGVTGATKYYKVKVVP